jgi:hypothetical protein
LKHLLATNWCSSSTSLTSNSKTTAITITWQSGEVFEYKTEKSLPTCIFDVVFSLALVEMVPIQHRRCWCNCAEIICPTRYSRCPIRPTSTSTPIHTPKELGKWQISQQKSIHTPSWLIWCIVNGTNIHSIEFVLREIILHKLKYRRQVSGPIKKPPF